MNRRNISPIRFQNRKQLNRALLSMFLITVLLAWAPLVSACGPFTLQAVFAFTVHPGFPLERYAAGEIGVVQPTFARSYLYVAYRHLSGAGFDKPQERALLELWQERLNFRWDPKDEDAIAKWNAARSMVAREVKGPEIEVYRHRDKPNEYQTYLNCPNDAFLTAAATLNDRSKKLESAIVKDWVTAQDLVFANCSAGKHIPAPAPPTTEPLVRADRDYQIAAASFYSGDFAEAEKRFRTIAEDKSSPWQKQAPYLIARTLIRKASLGPSESGQPSLNEAETVLNQLLSNDELTETHEAARRLLNIVRLRLYPELKLQELGKSLRENPGPSIKQDLWDYTLLLDKFLGDDDSAETKPEPAFVPQDELTDWIVTFQTTSESARVHAAEKWQQTASLPWLFATLVKAKAGDPEMEDLLKAASEVKPDAAAFPGMSFHTVRLLSESGRNKQARQKLDELLAEQRSRFTVSAQNLLLGQRMALSQNLEEFLTYSQRLPAGITWDEDDRQLPAHLDQDSETDKKLQHQVRFDIDAASTLNRGMPLEVLKQAAESEALPVHLRRDVAQAAWLRAVMLDEPRVATELVPVLRKLVPEAAPLLVDYASAPENLKRFLAIYLWLKFPGLEPVVDVGIGRGTPLNEQDTYRDNWWCGAAYIAESDKASSENLSEFITAEQRATAEKEFANLVRSGAAPNYLAQQVIEWSTKAGTDRRIPEALHLVVRSTRYGCGDKETGKWSKAAFDLLHKRYPSSVWARRTPYWFQN
ncbi:MAG TPA: hypothetical protein VMM84_01415 [Pyrinomonadaceae bacterium]|nr:hypothetical protein [Pyrinomonadaceae bacterium]